MFFYKKIREILNQEKDFLINLTQEIVRIPSVNPKLENNPELNKESQVQDVLEKVLRKEGFIIDRWDVSENRPNVIANKSGKDERSLILCGHVDVVPTGDQSAWSVDPFGGEIKDGKLFGRGSLDMKSGLTAAIAATRAIRLAGIELEGRLSIHSVVDEETGGTGAKEAVKKGHLAKSILVLEPTRGNIICAEGGLEWVRVTIPGRSAHAGFRFNEIWPQHHTTSRLVPAVNAIELSTRFLNALRDFEHYRCRTKYHPLSPLGLATINPGVIRGGVGEGKDGLPIIMSNPAMVSDIVTIDLDYKFLPNEKQAKVRKEFEEFVHNFSQTDPWLKENPIRVQWELGGLYFPPMNTPVDHPLIQSLIKQSESINKHSKIYSNTGVCDVSHYSGAGLSGVVFGSKGGGIHGLDEYVDIQSLLNTTQIIACTILDWCGVKKLNR